MWPQGLHIVKLVLLLPYQNFLLSRLSLLMDHRPITLGVCFIYAWVSRKCLTGL